MQGHKQRNIGSGLVIGVGNAGGIVAAFCFVKDDALLYKRGCWILILADFFIKYFGISNVL